jgi:serine/tyrosine/threonine adenylyltransferase
MGATMQVDFSRTANAMFENSYSSLPSVLFKAVSSTPVVAPKLVAANDAYAPEIGLDKSWLHSPEALQALSGNAPLQNTLPVAMAYAGHQFGHWVPSLGDGRAILAGEIVGPDGIRRDLHLKGAGRTPYSRNGDGRATLGAMLREYIVSEAMHALGIPTTRSLAVVATGENIMREGLFPGAILTRVAKSHVRVGTFQYLSARQEDDAMRALADYEIARNFPHAPNGSERYLWLLSEAIARQASLIAKWMNVGFIHGVMNTDNMQVAGETIDYGPCAFMDTFHPQKVFSSIDQNGRYAWDKQPVIALWNLTRLAEALLPLFDADRERAIALAQEELKKFMPAFEQAFEQGLLQKLGIMNRREGDAQFIAQTLQHMIDTDADFTLFFSNLSEQSVTPSNEWQAEWRKRLAEDNTDLATQHQTMRAANPIYVPRNHRIEQAITAANSGDFEPFNRLVKVLHKPFDRQPENAAYTEAPTAQEQVHETFCGT